MAKSPEGAECGFVPSEWAAPARSLIPVRARSLGREVIEPRPLFPRLGKEKRRIGSRSWLLATPGLRASFPLERSWGWMSGAPGCGSNLQGANIERGEEKSDGGASPTLSLVAVRPGNSA